MNEEKWKKSWAIKLDYELFLNSVAWKQIYKMIFKGNITKGGTTYPDPAEILVPGPPIRFW